MGVMGNKDAHKRAHLLKQLRKDKQGRKDGKVAEKCSTTYISWRVRTGENSLYFGTERVAGTDALHPHNSKCSLSIMYATRYATEAVNL